MKNKTKILLVSNMYPSNKYPYYGVFVKNVYTILSNEYDVDLAVLSKHNNKLIKLFAYFKFYFITLVKCLFNNYDFIYVNFISHSAIIPVFVKKFKKNLKIVFNAHGNDIIADNKFDLKNEKKSNKYLKYANNVVVPSNYFRNILINNYNIDNNIITVYPSGGIDTSLFKSIERKDALNHFNLVDGISYIGYVSRIETNKGYDVFVKAISELKKDKKIDNKKFIIVGNGSEENKLNALISEYDLSELIIRMDLLSQDELVYLYNALDIFVFSTMRKSESLGLVGLEAMSTKTFVIASNNYGPTDYVIDGKNGFLFNPNDEKDLKNKILNYYELKDKDKILDNARNTALKYDNTATKDIIINLFK